MTVKQLREALVDVPDGTEIFLVFDGGQRDEGDEEHFLVSADVGMAYYYADEKVFIIEEAFEGEGND